MESAKNHLLTPARIVAVNELGQRIGEDHPNAILTDAEIETVRQLHEEGMDYVTLAEKFGISKWSVGRICRYERRAQSPAGFRQVHVPDAA